ncbi:MAG TPA: hypothetical protein VLT59_07745, partial [Steroidobacteraceae bacterium]|nr:hypothetical protein [Steroidobacteraceae bacterium]
MSLSVAFALASLATGAGNAPLTDLLHRWRDEEPVVGAVAGLTGDDLRLYSGVGALHCEIAGEERIATAFLVGAFDVVVTVAHAFDAGERDVGASDCTFVNTGADGRVVERIRVAEFRSKWVDDPSARGSPWQDVAVARLERIS